MTALDVVSSYNEIKLSEAPYSEGLSYQTLENKIYTVKRRRSIVAILHALRAKSTTYDEDPDLLLTSSQSSTFDVAVISAEMANILYAFLHNESPHPNENRFFIKYREWDTSLALDVEALTVESRSILETIDENEYKQRYGDLDIDRIREQLSPEAFEIFMNTVGAVEVPLQWTRSGKPIYYGDLYSDV